MSNNKILGIKKELEQIRKTHKGFLRPEDVVEYARNQNTELHGMFCWTTPRPRTSTAYSRRDI